MPSIRTGLTVEAGDTFRNRSATFTSTIEIPPTISGATTVSVNIPARNADGAIHTSSGPRVEMAEGIGGVVVGTCGVVG